MKLSITVLLLCTFQLCYSQDYWINYTNTHKINDVVETDQGFWLGSDGGLCHYNTETGKETYYNKGNSLIRSNNVIDLLHQNDGSLWIVTDRGLSRMKDDVLTLGDPNLKGKLLETLDEKVVVATNKGLNFHEEGMEFNFVEYPVVAVELGMAEIHPETGDIYVFGVNWYSESFLAVWNDNEWTILFSEYTHGSMVMDKNHKIWRYTYNEGLQYFENGDWNIVSGGILPEEMRNPQLYVNQENQILIENEVFEDYHLICKTLYVWNGESMEELNYDEDTCPELHYFIKPSDDESNVYYASSRDEGFYNFTTNEINEPKRLAQSPMVQNNVVNTLHLSDDSHFVIYNDAIRHIKFDIWSEVSIPDEISGSIKEGFLDDLENLWIMDDNFLWTNQEDTWTKLTLPGEITEQLENAAFGDNGDIWIQSNQIIARYRNDNWEIFNSIDHGIPSGNINDMKVDPGNGDLWVTSSFGVRQYDGQTWESYTPDTYDNAYGIAIGNGGAFIRFNNLIRFIENGDITMISVPPEDFYHGFASKLMYDSEQEELYISGYDKMAVYHEGQWTIYKNSDSGLYAGQTNDIALDNNGNVWLSGHEGGISVFNKNGLIALSDENEIWNEISPSIQVYPTLLSQDQFFVESDVSGLFQIMLTDINGQVIYNQKQRLLKGLPKAIDFTSGNNKLILISIGDGTSMITRKIFKM